MSLSGPSLGFWGVTIWSKFVFLNTVCQKHYKNMGFQHFCFWKKLRAKIWGVIIWSKFAFLKTRSTWTRYWPVLGPDNDLSKCIFCVFWLLKMCQHTQFYSVCWKATKIGKKHAPPKSDNFSLFAKHKLIKNPLCCSPLLTKNWCFLNLHFLKKKTFDVEQKQN